MDALEIYEELSLRFSEGASEVTTEMARRAAQLLTQENSEDVARFLITNRPRTIKPGSVAAEVYACMGSKGTLNLGGQCADHAAAFRPSTMPNDKPIYMRTLDGLKRINSVPGSEAYVIMSGTADALSESEFDILRADGIISLMVYDKDESSITHKSLSDRKPEEERKGVVLGTGVMFAIALVALIVMAVTCVAIWLAYGKKSIRSHSEWVSSSLRSSAIIL